MCSTGGEEFAWIIHGIDIDDTLTALERLHTGVFSCKFPNSIRMSISMGLTRYDPNNNDSIEKLIDRADKALYRAKADGKNRIEASV